MAEGEEYLVAGHKGRYGEVAVNVCSRTQLLKTAQLDLRTLDGTHCTAPGGTIIGHVLGEWDRSKQEYKPANTEAVTFSDLAGKTYHSKVDEDGIFELQHLPPLLYAPNSRLDVHRFISSFEWEYQFAPLSTVREGLCQEHDLIVHDYQLTGRLLAGINRAVRVELLATKPGSKPIRSRSVEPDGRFYFNDLAPGEYVLSVTSTIGYTNPQIFYPGVTDRAKAERISIPTGVVGRSFDFDPRVLPVVPVSVALDRVAGSDRFLWDFQLVQGDQVISVSRAEGTDIGLVYGMRGEAYRLRLDGYPRNPSEDNYCTSGSVAMTATAGAAPVHITAQCGGKQ